MKRYIFRFSIFFVLTFTVTLIILTDSYSQDKDDQKSTDETILVTDDKGYILSGDKKDWSFSDKNYNELISKDIFSYIPVKKSEITIPALEPFTYEIIGDKLILNWVTAKEINCKGFAVERAERMSDEAELNWKEIGYERGHKNSNKQNKYSFTDKKLKEGKYLYRLKQESFDGSFEYFNLNSEVYWMKFPATFQFYPVYPNPVTDSFYVRFFLPMKDEISLFFVKGNDTIYILENGKLEQGFYIMALDKNTYGFNNEIKRLYIKRRSFKKKEYYGDIKFK